MTFLKDQFLLTTKTAQRLYQEVAAREPILDFHSRLSPTEVLRNQGASDPFDFLVAGDAAKLQLMRANGIEERLITGDATALEKFIAFAKTLPRALRHPIYEATHLELKRLCGVDWLIQEKTARAIWDAVLAKLKTPENTPRGLLRKLRVIAQCIVTDPADPLQPFATLRAERGSLRLLPTFRADPVITVDADFTAWCARLAEATGVETRTWEGFHQACRQRQEEFHALGCRIADYSLPQMPALACDEATAKALFLQARSGESLAPPAAQQLAGAMFSQLAADQTQRAWALHLHLGGLGNGFNDRPQAEGLATFIQAHPRAKLLVEVRNPAALHAVGSVLAGGLSQLDLSDSTPGARGWEERLEAASRHGLLGRSVGIGSGATTVPGLLRHEHFRRVLCNVIGRDFETGTIPAEWDLAAKTVRDICSRNAARFFGIDPQIG